MTQQNNITNIEELQEALIDNDDFMKDLVQGALQKILNAQFENYLNASKYERTDSRTGYRNGGYERQLRTRIGSLSLYVCRDREGNFQPSLFHKYQRNEKALVMTIAEMYFKGISTRKIEPVIEELCGFGISKSQVSELSKAIDSEIQEWKDRPLEKKYNYLFVDALVLKVRENGKVVTKSGLIGIGVNEEGYREVIACEIGDCESERTWSDFFKNLKKRGFKGIKLVISDDHAGLKKAIELHFQGVQWQRCQVHFMRNFLKSLSKTDQGQWVAYLKDVFDAPTLEQAKNRARDLSEKLSEKKKDKLASWLDTNVEECLAVYHFPEEHRRRLRTTNVAERFNEEIRRRSNVIRIFPNEESLMRILASQCIDMTEKWMEKKYMTMESVELQKAM